MTRNILITVLTIVFMIAVGVIIFWSGDFPMKMVWLALSFFLSALGVFRKVQKNKTDIKETEAKLPSQIMRDDNWGI